MVDSNFRVNGLLSPTLDLFLLEKRNILAPFGLDRKNNFGGGTGEGGAVGWGGHLPSCQN